MTNSELLPAAVLRRKAVVYVRQSTQTQVQTNLESQRRQYDLVQEARRRGFAQARRTRPRAPKSIRMSSSSPTTTQCRSGNIA